LALSVKNVGRYDTTLRCGRRLQQNDLLGARPRVGADCSRRYLEHAERIGERIEVDGAGLEGSEDL
jgi:hypothetical protein